MRAGLTVSGLLDWLYQEFPDEGHNLDSFTSFLGVCCGRFLALQLTGDITGGRTVSIRSLDAISVLAREEAHLRGRTMVGSAFQIPDGSPTMGSD